jgi:hypothetical protein
VLLCTAVAPKGLVRKLAAGVSALQNGGWGESVLKTDRRCLCSTERWLGWISTENWPQVSLLYRKVAGVNQYWKLAAGVSTLQKGGWGGSVLLKTGCRCLCSTKWWLGWISTENWPQVSLLYRMVAGVVELPLLQNRATCRDTEPKPGRLKKPSTWKSYYFKSDGTVPTTRVFIKRAEEILLMACSVQCSWRIQVFTQCLFKSTVRMSNFEEVQIVMSSLLLECNLHVRCLSLSSF